MFFTLADSAEGLAHSSLCMSVLFLASEFLMSNLGSNIGGNSAVKAVHRSSGFSFNAKKPDIPMETAIFSW